jgi:hypothetical protein
MRCTLVSWDEFCKLARRLTRLIASSGYQADMIVAIGRGGYMPARLLSDGLDIYNLTGFKIEHYRAARKQAQALVRYPLCADVTGLKLLLVDDVSDDGGTFAAAVSHLKERGPPDEVRTAVLHHKSVSGFAPDYHAAEVTEWHWLIYPWAVIEDVSGFIRDRELVDAPVEAMQTEIEACYGVRVPVQTLEDARSAVMCSRQRRHHD